MKEKLTDALWPFIPSNQVHLPEVIRSISDRRRSHERTDKQRYSYIVNRDELYGPLWIMITLIVELLILGHVSKLLKIELGMGMTAEDTSG